ncbi:MAG: formate dehydrogenase accessory sulfurtransferase FdhD [Tissierellia bacterium]|nr:formate dehydrogenase accessory sulfurtransferase FdhD [Tissierellia bacterium]
MDNIKKCNIIRIKGEEILEEEDIVILEYPLTIFLNDEEIVTLLCSPSALKGLVVGFLYSENFIESFSDIQNMRIDKDKGMAYVYLRDVNRFSERFRGKRTITSGCGKGTVFYNVLDSFKSKKVEKQLPIRTCHIKELIKEFNKKSQLFIKTGGVHSCALCNTNEILIFEEDIGRHNALDKVFGKALMDDIDTRDKIILTSGRISSEILIKTAKRQIPVIVSRSAPTSLAVEMANKLKITLIGFARGQKMNIYSNLSSFID